MKKIELLLVGVLFVICFSAISSCVSHRVDDTKDTVIHQKNRNVEPLLKEADTCLKNKQYMRPAGMNAYELYRKVYEIEPSNEYARDRIRYILNVCLNDLDKHIDLFNKLLEEKGNVKDELNSIITGCKDVKKICEDSKLPECDKIVMEINTQIDRHEKFYELLFK